MNKFKVGDKVKVVSNEASPANNYCGGHAFPIGTAGTVYIAQHREDDMSALPYYNVVDDTLENWWVAEDDLELVGTSIPPLSEEELGMLASTLIFMYEEHKFCNTPLSELFTEEEAEVVRKSAHRADLLDNMTDAEQLKLAKSLVLMLTGTAK